MLFFLAGRLVEKLIRLGVGVRIIRAHHKLTGGDQDQRHTDGVGDPARNRTASGDVDHGQQSQESKGHWRRRSWPQSQKLRQNVCRSKMISIGLSTLTRALALCAKQSIDARSASLFLLTGGAVVEVALLDGGTLFDLERLEEEGGTSSELEMLDDGTGLNLFPHWRHRTVKGAAIRPAESRSPPS